MHTTSYESTKVIPLGSCAFRQPYAQSHCRFIHGYRLQAKFWFGCNKLDENNWVVDFGALKDLKKLLEETFDHTLVVWEKDPELPIFKMLHDKGVVDLRVFSNGVGIEMFASFCLEKANEFVSKITNDRCWCHKVEIWEHEGNSAVANRINQMHLNTSTVFTETTPITEPVKLEIKSTPITAPSTPTKQEPTSPPLYTTKTTNTFKDPFAGTSWGNSAKRTK